MTEHSEPIDRQELLALATRKTDTISRNLRPEQPSAATRLLADPYATGLRHGIDPDLWAAVANLGVEVLDPLALRDKLLPPRHTPRTGLARPITTASVQGPDLGQQR